MLLQDVTQTNLLIYSALNLQQVAKQASSCQALCCEHVSVNTVAQICHILCPLVQVHSPNADVWYGKGDIWTDCACEA